MLLFRNSAPVALWCNILEWELFGKTCFLFQAMVKFENLPRNKLVLLECRAYAMNIEQDITAKLGLVTFELLLEDLPVEEPKEGR